MAKDRGPLKRGLHSSIKQGFTVQWGNLLSLQAWATKFKLQERNWYENRAS